MSTKIWTAWRCPINRFNDFIDITNRHMFEEAVVEFQRWMARTKLGHIEAELAKKKAVYEKYKWPIKDEEWADGGWIQRSICFEAAWRVVVQLYTAKGGGYNVLGCGLNVWLHVDKAYFIPWGPPNFYFSLPVPEWAEDYHYQNQTDRPSEVPEDEWNARGVTWDAIIGYNGWDDHRLTYSVIDLDPGSGSTSYGRLMMAIYDHS